MLRRLEGGKFYLESKSEGNFTLVYWGDRKISLVNFHKRGAKWLLTTHKPTWKTTFEQLTGVKPGIKQSIVAAVNDKAALCDIYRFYLTDRQLDDVLNYIIQTCDVPNG